MAQKRKKFVKHLSARRKKVENLVKEPTKVKVPRKERRKSPAMKYKNEAIKLICHLFVEDTIFTTRSRYCLL